MDTNTLLDNMKKNPEASKAALYVLWSVIQNQIEETEDTIVPLGVVKEIIEFTIEAFEKECE